MKEIQLTKGYVALVDDEDFEWLNSFNWHLTRQGYASSSGNIDGKYQRVLMHRILMGCKYGDGKIIDHKDRNQLNCQKNNLRVCSHSQNCSNQKSAKNSTSDFLGVSFHSARGRWRATIFKNYKQMFIGYFDNQKEAALAYNKKAVEVHGEFANLNIIE